MAGEILFTVDVNAEPVAVLRALTSVQGIRSWWTDRCDGDGAAGGTIKPALPVAPMPFELHVDGATDSSVRWTSTGGFPPHWAGSQVSWDVVANPDGPGVLVNFKHAGFPSDDGIGMVAYTWGQLMTSLKAYAESGSAAPLFKH
ncbi:MAG: SRPBCC domain-containing protein [Chloroflexi bacterium]|nr:SRPBCC domain-containing protein [Chloroflexota bacterium]MDA1146870.1 SRPBCC domain-containing protein [Chloroflexota bacterium]